MPHFLKELRRFFRDLKRRNVYKVALAYLAVAFVAVQAAQILVPPTTLPAWADDFLIYLAAFGFPIALVIAWAFEVTPEGIRRTGELEPGGTEPEEQETVASETGSTTGGTKTAYKLLLGLGLAAGAVVGGWYLTGGGDRLEITDRTVAVLPFETLGQEETTAFTEGVQTGILSRLSNISGLVVKSRTSVMRYRQSDASLPEIGRALGVSWVVRGEVQESGDQVQVNARLVHSRRDQQIWTGTYRRELTAENLFAVQEEITTRIAEELQTQLSPGERERIGVRPTENLAAYELYVRGRTLLEQRTEPEIRRARELFQRAISRDSSYALAWAGLSDAYSLLWFYGYSPADSVASRSLAAARRAVELEPRSGTAHSSLGIALSLRRDGPEALRELERAVELQPGYAEAQIWLSWVRLMVGRPVQALEPGRRAVELDPLAPANRAYLAEAYLANGAADSARREARRARELRPDYSLAHYMEGLVLHHLGRNVEADSAFRRSLSLTSPGGAPSPSEIYGALAVTRAALGDTSAARLLLRRIDAEADPFSAGLVHAALGEEERAFSAFERVRDWGSFDTENLRYFFPEALSTLRGDPRYRELLQKVNLAWGLEADGSLPEAVAVSLGSKVR